MSSLVDRDRRDAFTVGNLAHSALKRCRTAGPVTIAAEMIPADAEALYRLLVEMLAPAQRVELAVLLLEDGTITTECPPGGTCL
jgi:hypothetical protein